MADFGTGYDDTSPVRSERHEATRFDVASHPWGVAGLGFLGGALGTMIVRALFRKHLAFTAGDEPPIRVRNGSLAVEVLDEDDAWEDISSGAGRTWRLKLNRRRAGQRLQILPLNTKCDLQIVSAQTLRVQYKDSTRVHIVASGLHTNVVMITPGKRLVRSQPTRLDYQAECADSGNFITGIEASGGGSLHCTFDERTQLKGVYIFDW